MGFNLGNALIDYNPIDEKGRTHILNNFYTICWLFNKILT